MRRTGCRPGTNDIRCKLPSKSTPYDSIIEDVNQTQKSKLLPAQTQAQAQSRPTPKDETRPSEIKKKIGLVVPGPIAKATQQSLTTDQIAKAMLTKASDIFYKEGEQKTTRYLKDNGLDYTVDWQLSNNSGLVLIDNATGKVVVSYRGSDISSPSDWETGMAMLKNVEAQNNVFKDAKTQMVKVVAEYNVPQELLGFSRGGTLAMSLGNEYGVNTTTFNPFVNKNLVTTLKTDAEHTIIRTTTDAISIGANLPNPSFNVIHIDPKADSLNPMTNHELSQFLDNNTPRRTAPQELLQKFAESTGKAQSELITVKDMSQAVNEGKSFSEFINDFSPVDIPGGVLSSRIYEGSNFSSWWKESGGSFNPIEQAHLSSTPKGVVSETGTTSSHREEFAKLSPAEQDIKIGEITDVHMKAIEKFSNFSSGEAQVQEVFANQKISPNLSESASTALTEQLSGASLGAGLIGSYVGNKAVQYVDPDQKLKAQGDEAVSGFIAGGVGAALAGGALLPAAVVGSVGMLTGSETSRALQKAGVSKESSSTLGGATGGATAGLAAASLGLGAAVLGGAEIGAAFAPETFGISIAVGAAIGGIAGLASSLWDDAFGNDPEPPIPPQKNAEVSQAFLDNIVIRRTIRAPSSKQPPVVIPPVLPTEPQAFADKPLPRQRPLAMTSTYGKSSGALIPIKPDSEPKTDFSTQTAENKI